MVLIQGIKMKKIIFLALFIILQNLSAEGTEAGNAHSILFFGNINGNFGTSDGMLGSVEEFVYDMKFNNYNNRYYPFGDDDTQTNCFGFQYMYKTSEKYLSFYGAFAYTSFYQEQDDANEMISEKAEMDIYSFTPGLEFCIGSPNDLWNTFIRGGVNFNIIKGFVEYDSGTTDVLPAFRVGFEGELGGRCNIPGSSIGIEVSANYSQANYIGKSYTAHGKIFGETLNERELNDMGQTGNIYDKNRVIAFLSLRIGLRYWI